VQEYRSEFRDTSLEMIEPVFISVIMGLMDFGPFSSAI